MKRRGFLKRLAGVATAAVVSEKLIPDDGVSLFSARHPGMIDDMHDYTEGFGLVSVKAEGATIPYDLTEESLEQACIDIVEEHGSGCLTRSEFSKQIGDSLNEAFRDVYRDYEPGGWDDDDV